jgi:hypothetical protein
MGYVSRLRKDMFLFFTASRPALGPTQPPVKLVKRALSLGVKLTTHLHLVPRLRMVDLYFRSPIRLTGVVLH